LLWGLMKLAIAIGLFLPAYYDWKTRWVDDRSWLALLPAYLLLGYGVLIEAYPLVSVLEGVIFSIIIIGCMYLFRKMGYVLGGADFILMAIVAPLSFVYKCPYLSLGEVFPGFLLFLFLTSILSVTYVFIVAIWRNRDRFHRVRGIKDFIRLLYSYETEEVDEDKEILVYDRDGVKYVTPGIPMVSFAFIASLLLLILDFIP